MSDLPYRPCVGIVLFNAAGKVFVAQRLDRYEDAWQLPQGGIDKGEQPLDAAFRELEEETGTANVELVGESADWLSYDLPSDLVGKVWQGRFRGQTQKWFAMRFLGSDEEIDPTAVSHPEFKSWRWTDLAQLPALAVPFKRDVYAAISAEFASLANSHATTEMDVKSSRNSVAEL